MTAELCFSRYGESEWGTWQMLCRILLNVIASRSEDDTAMGTMVLMDELFYEIWNLRLGFQIPLFKLSGIPSECQVWIVSWKLLGPWSPICVCIGIIVFISYVKQLQYYEVIILWCSVDLRIPEDCICMRGSCESSQKCVKFTGMWTMMKVFVLNVCLYFSESACQEDEDWVTWLDIYFLPIKMEWKLPPCFNTVL